MDSKMRLISGYTFNLIARSENKKSDLVKRLEYLFGTVNNWLMSFCLPIGRNENVALLSFCPPTKNSFTDIKEKFSSNF